MRKLSSQIDENIETAKEILPIGTSFDMITRDLFLGETRGYWIGINGFCRTEILQQIFSDLQNPIYEGFLYRRYQALHECQNRLCPGFLDGGLG